MRANSVLTTYLPASFTETVHERSEVFSSALSTLMSSRPCYQRFCFYCASSAAIGVVLIVALIVHRLLQINERSEKNQKETNAKMREINKELEELNDESNIRQDQLCILIEKQEKRFNQGLEEMIRLKKELRMSDAEANKK